MPLVQGFTDRGISSGDQRSRGVCGKEHRARRNRFTKQIVHMSAALFGARKRKAGLEQRSDADLTEHKLGNRRPGEMAFHRAQYLPSTELTVGTRPPYGHFQTNIAEHEPGWPVAMPGRDHHARRLCIVRRIAPDIPPDGPPLGNRRCQLLPGRSRISACTTGCKPSAPPNALTAFQLNAHALGRALRSPLLRLPHGRRSPTRSRQAKPRKMRCQGSFSCDASSVRGFPGPVAPKLDEGSPQPDIFTSLIWITGCTLVKFEMSARRAVPCSANIAWKASTES